MCAIPSLVDASPRILEALTNVPGIKQVTEAFVRVTFFDQFVAGDSAEGTLSTLRKLRKENIGALFAYSVEVDEKEAAGHAVNKGVKDTIHERIVNEMIHSINVAADFEASQGTNNSQGRTWVAIKISALLPDARALINLSKHVLQTRSSRRPIHFPGCPDPSDLDVLYESRGEIGPLSTQDIQDLRELHANLVRICSKAQERGVKIIVDAEYSWYQPALDAFTLSLMREFNKLPHAKDTTKTLQPLIYATFQAYLRRTPAYLAQSIKDAKLGHFSLGVKLVRGAYHSHELVAHPTPQSTIGGPTTKSLSISPDALPPVWTSKLETDACYNQCAVMLLNSIRDDIITGSVPSIGVLFGTHNRASCDLILNTIGELGLGERNSKGQLLVGDALTERLTLGQLYGMADVLTRHLTASVRANTPFVIKYVPYGALSEAMPYLARRAIENKSVLGDGGAISEKNEAAAGIYKRLFG